MSTENTKQQETASSKVSQSGTYPICNGAMCQCEFGSIPSSFKVISQAVTFLNDKDGADKLAASTKDIGNPFETPFGSCGKNNNSPCVPVVTEWKDPYKGVRLANEGHIITEKSKGVCSAAGKDCITFMTSGQTQEASQQDVQETPSEQATALAPVLSGAQLQQIIQGIFNEDGDDDKGRGISKINATKKSDTNNNTYHVDEPIIQFKVREPTNLTAKEKQAVNWVVYIKNEKKNTYKEHYTFVDKGAVFDFPYRSSGVYVVEAYGGRASFINKRIEAAYHEFIITDKQTINNTLAGPFVASKSYANYGRVRPTDNVVIKATTLFPSATELIKAKDIYWEVTINGIVITDFINQKPLPQITIPAKHYKSTKNVKVTATYKNNTTKELKFKIGKNYVKAIDANKDTIAVWDLGEKKDRHQVLFTVSEFRMPFDALKDASPTWCVYDKSVRVAKQEVIALKKKGKKPSAALLTLSKKHTIITEGVSGNTYTGISKEAGEWFVEAFASNPTGNNNTCKLLTVIIPTILKAYWANEKGYKIHRSGFKHKVYLH